MKKFTDTILMIRPVSFGYNAQTAVNNAFQEKPGEESAESIQSAALKEFETFVAKLQEVGVRVLVVDDTKEPHTPDAIFPNNWVSFHESGQVITYPMYAENRRLERRKDILDRLELDWGFKISEKIDWSGAEDSGKYLEGTGSMIFDRKERVVFACLSPRTDQWMLDKFSQEMNFGVESFRSVDEKGGEIYHTNVMMCLGDGFACIVEESIPDASERKSVIDRLEQLNNQVISLTYDQMNAFAGNMLQLKNQKGENVLVLSQQAYESLHASQISRLEKHSAILYSDIRTIEKYGGGSVRCMLAEVFLPAK